VSPTQLDLHGATSFERWCPADVRTLGTLRADLERWLGELGVPAAASWTLVLAVHELVANAVEHSASDAPVHVRVVRGGDGVSIEVRDAGRWREGSSTDRSSDDRGRGLVLVTRAVGSVEVVTGPSGTTVTAYAPLSCQRTGWAREVSNL
jgi:serine/threonine-protein kinase RsbW